MIALRVNGVSRQFHGDPNMPLLWYLRDELGLTGSKYGCGAGLCGACTVHVGGGVRFNPDVPPSPPIVTGEIGAASGVVDVARRLEAGEREFVVEVADHNGTRAWIELG